MTVSDEQ